MRRFLYDLAAFVHLCRASILIHTNPRIVMLLDFEVRACSRSCTKTGRALGPGDVYFSVLEVQETETVRLDYSAEAWEGAPEDCLGWWRSRIALKTNTAPRLAPTDVMLNLFGALADKPDDRQFRYLLGLLLIRRRVLKRQDSSRDEEGNEILTLHASRRDAHYELVVAEPDEEQAALIQQRMIDLLYGDAEIEPLPTNSDEGEA